jgi:predicted MFS family arabinose efflux permease
MRFLVWGTMPLGALLGGALGQFVGVRQTVWIGSIAGALAFLPVFLSPLRGMRDLPRHDEREAGMMAT